MICLKHKIVKIKKERKCWGCLRLFNVGSKMEVLVSADGFGRGKIWSTYHCLTCVKLKDHILLRFDESDFPEGWYEEYCYSYSSHHDSPEEFFIEHYLIDLCSRLGFELPEINFKQLALDYSNKLLNEKEIPIFEPKSI